MEKIFKVFHIIGLVLIAFGAVASTFMAFTGIGLNEGYTTAQAIPYALMLDVGSIVYIVASVKFNS